MTDVLVIGAGVTGLTTAICLAEAGLQVQIMAAELPGRTTSAVAGAIWGPHLVEDSDRVTRWCADTLSVLTGLSGAGVRLASGMMASRAAGRGPELPAELARVGGGIGPCPAADLPAGFAAGWRYTAPVVSMPVYLDYLLGRFGQAGGELRTGTVASLAGAAAGTAAPVIVNCTGTGAYSLVPDPAVTPYRGQVVVAENPGLTEFFIGQPDEEHELVYVFPHDGRVVLGGTEVAGDWSAEPDPGTARRILRDCAAVDPRLATARVIEHRVGLRPARPQVRLEAEAAVAADGRRQHLVVHNYGHGGAGVTLSWGCAREVAGLVTQLA
ncbi:MAG TPA: FAD-dependent oxidoreductase [Streptosporangiaceae bacterium]|nr:FAD-dependent oxidoreductase [Streptosporangiaceae bacterium]